MPRSIGTRSVSPKDAVFLPLEIGRRRDMTSAIGRSCEDRKGINTGWWISKNTPTGTRPVCGLFAFVRGQKRTQEGRVLIEGPDEST